MTEAVKDKAPDKAKSAERELRQIELAVIGYVLLFPQQVYEVSSLDEDHFMEPSRRLVFSAMMSLYKQHGPSGVDSVATIMAECVRRGLPDGKAMLILTESNDFAPTTGMGIAPIVDRLHANAARRALAQVATQIEGLSRGSGSATELHAKAMECVHTAVKSPTTEIQSLAEELENEAEKMRMVEHGIVADERGLPFGITCLDAMTAGLCGGELTVIGARPSVGKSALLNHIVMANAYVNQTPTLVFSREMPRRQWAQRVVCTKSQLDLHRVNTRTLGPEQRQEYIEWCKELQKAPIYIHDHGSANIAAIGGAIRRAQHELGVKLVGIDYLQLLDHGQQRGESKESAISRTSNALKALAMSTGIPIIALAQLNRQCEARDNKRPRLSDLRDSGSIEQDADIVIFLYRDMMYRSADEQRQKRNDPEEIDLIIAKQRQGPVGTGTCMFMPTCGLFYTAEDL